jgi:phosphate starvation-inducible protein PhoH and related proteins
LSKTSSLHIKLKEGVDPRRLFGNYDTHLKMIEKAFGIQISARGNDVYLQGPSEPIRQAESLLVNLSGLMSEGFTLRSEDVEYAIQTAREDPNVPAKGLFADRITVPSKKRFVIPKTAIQKQYVEAIRKYDLVIGIGPAGTGKTYLAMAMAVSALIGREVSRIILARPAVEAGERLGFLPGDMYAKVNPYLRPLYDALYDMMEVERANRLVERGDIEIAPLAYMRGRTLNDSFIILDEAQNATAEQMKMFATRLGFNSKAVITGDVTQVDLPSDRTSGLIEIQGILNGITGIQFVYFTEKDVVRHRLVQEIIKAYERYEGKAEKGKRKP